MKLDDKQKEECVSGIEDLRTSAGDKLTKWEADFLDSVQWQVEEQGWITEKQQQTITRIGEKYL